MSGEDGELAAAALEAASRRGVSYADVRVVRTEEERLAVRNGSLVAFESPRGEGIAVRVLHRGAWGFAASHRLSKDEGSRLAARAVAAADALAALRVGSPVELAPAPAVVDRWEGPVAVDPFGVPIERKLDLLLRCDEVLRKSAEVVATSCSMRFFRERKHFASTEGSRIDQTTVRSGAGIAATAAGGGDVQTRSFPNSLGGQFQAAGYEMVDALGLEGAAERVREEARALLRADPCLGGVRDLILGSSQLALQIHESCGHPSEGDRAIGTEIDLAGGSFLTPEKRGRLRFGSDLVTIVADATLPGGLGTFGYDDDGVRAGRFPVVERGIFRNYLTNRETARALGEDASRGACRAEGWRHFPIVRMVNLSLEPGAWDLEALLADTDDGVLCDTTKTWSIDSERLHFQFTTEIGWEVRGGKRTRLLKNPTYQGTTPAFWASCDAICDERHFALWGVSNCGKGNPLQTAAMSHGAPPARFRRVSFVGP